MCIVYVVKKVTSLGMVHNERALKFINLHDMYQLDKIRYIYCSNEYVYVLSMLSSMLCICISFIVIIVFSLCYPH